MVNLLGNAIHAIEGRPKKEIRIEARAEKGRVVIKVQDSGHGIPFKHLKMVFDPFYTTKKSGKGLGLGLTITERILNEMGGDIKAVKSDNGALFVISLHDSLERHESE